MSRQVLCSSQVRCETNCSGGALMSPRSVEKRAVLRMWRLSSCRQVLLIIKQLLQSLRSCNNYWSLRTCIWPFLVQSSARVIIFMSFGKRNASPAQPELIRKYGYGAVAELHEHLTSSLRNSPRRPMSQLHRTKQQIKYLELQQARYALKQRHTQAEHIMRCVDREKQHIFKEFSATKARDLQQLVQQIQQIEQQMQVEHIRELQQEVARQDSKRSGFLGGKSQHILELQHQLKALCQKELYEEAERVDKMIEREMIQLNNKKYYEWKEQKEKKIHLLRKNQQKQKQALRKRLQNLLDEQIKARNQQYEKLNKRYLVHRKKICYNLLKQPKSHKKITSESDRKNIGIESQFILEETEQKQIKTGLSTQVQTYRAVDLHTPQKNKASFE